MPVGGLSGKSPFADWDPELFGGVFDEVILYQDQCQRGRADGEVLGLLREGSD